MCSTECGKQQITDFRRNIYETTALPIFPSVNSFEVEFLTLRTMRIARKVLLGFMELESVLTVHYAVRTESFVVETFIAAIFME